jgi:hypothetical protein
MEWNNFAFACIGTYVQYVIVFRHHMSVMDLVVSLPVVAEI